MAATALQAPAQLATAAQPRALLTSRLPVLATPAGVSPAASALPMLRVVEMDTLSFTTPTALMMSVCGRSTALTGLSAVVVPHHATLMLTSHALRRYGHGVETLGNTGPHAESADAAAELKRLPRCSLRETPTPNSLSDSLI